MQSKAGANIEIKQFKLMLWQLSLSYHWPADLGVKQAVGVKLTD
jgi:hypothetical protein